MCIYMCTYIYICVCVMWYQMILCRTLISCQCHTMPRLQDQRGDMGLWRALYAITQDWSHNVTYTYHD